MDSSTATESCGQLLEPIASPEIVPLLSPEQPYRSTLTKKLSRINFIPRHLCLPSKAAVVILFWTTMVSAIYKTAEEIALHILDTKHLDKQISDNYGILFVYLAFVLVHLLYPFTGFLADVYCGRHKTVTISLCLLLCGNGCFCITSVLLFTGIVNVPYYTVKNTPYYFSTLGIGLIFLITGLSGYQANVVQLGLDQLLDVPSEYLGLFVHWLEVFTEIGFFIPRPLFVMFDDVECNKRDPVYNVVLGLPFLYVFLVLLLLLLGCWKHHWFYTEPGQNNPYKMVFKVLNFVRRHKYPLRRSAFTYCGDEDPSRIDFAKERYGGPFTTEQVEDVKTLFRILAILLVIGPVFFLEIPLGPLFNSFSYHTGSEKSYTQGCSWERVFQNTTLLRGLAAVISFPVYIWLIYSVLRRCIPRTLVRIWIGELLFLLGVITLFVVDSVGHAEYYTANHHAASCLFLFNDSHHSSYLDLPWAVNVLPAFLMEMALGLVITTTFEFISAQSPHSMKGLLIGVFYAIRGTFKFFGTISTLPFSLRVIWTSDYMKEHLPPITNCGFGYLLLNSTVGFVSLILFTVAAKRYKNRERNDPPFNQIIVERVWADDLQN